MLRKEVDTLALLILVLSLHTLYVIGCVDFLFMSVSFSLDKMSYVWLLIWEECQLCKNPFLSG